MFVSVLDCFFATFKKRVTQKKTYATRDEARGEIFNFIEIFYNPVKRHSHTGGVFPDQYNQALSHAGFKVGAHTTRRDFALGFFNQMRAKSKANWGPPPLGLHLLMQQSTVVKLKNMVDNITAGLIAPVEIIAQKQ